MKRNCTLEEISDGRLYGLNDMVKADCNECKGCSDCCHGMGDTVILDAYDVYRLEKGLGRDFSGLLSLGLELGIADGVILPHLGMRGEKEACAFLDENGRCSIHALRPGICRLFPLGRVYDSEGGFSYFLQINECSNKNRTKVKVKKWIDTPNAMEYERFVTAWHNLLERQEKLVSQSDEGNKRAVSLDFLKTFYVMPYDTDKDFYEQFEARCSEYCLKVMQ